MIDGLNALVEGIYSVCEDRVKEDSLAMMGRRGQRVGEGHILSGLQGGTGDQME